MKVVILIGGKGTRMSPMTNYWPKEMFPMVNKPFLQIIFDALSSLGIKNEDICLVSSKEKKCIQEIYPQYNYLYDNGSGFSNAVYYSKKFVKNDDFMLILGDMFLYNSLLLTNMLSIYQRENASVIGTFNPGDDFYKYCEVTIGRNDCIESFIEKPKVKTTGICTTGQYIFKNSFYEILKKYTDMKDAFGFTKAMNEYTEPLLNCFSVSGTMLDVGNLENYVKSINYVSNQFDFNLKHFVILTDGTTIDTKKPIGHVECYFKQHNNLYQEHIDGTNSKVGEIAKEVDTLE